MKSSRRNSRPKIHRFRVATLRDRHIDICHNLRPAPRGGGLCAIRKPVRLDIPAMPGARILPGGLRRVGGRRVLFIEYNGRLVCVDLADKSVTTMPEAPGIPCAILSTPSGLIVMMGEEGCPMLLSRVAAVWRWRSMTDMPAPVAVVRKDLSTLSVTIPEGRLRGDYDSRSRDLTPDDAATLRKAIVEAYCSLGDLAVSRRAFFQPVMARCLMRGHGGEVLYVSPPVLVVPLSGPQLTGADFTLSGEGLSSYSSLTLTAQTFSLSLRACAPLGEEWRGLVKCVEISLSPQLHPLDDRLDADFTFGRFTATGVILHVTLPGVDATKGTAAFGSALRSQVEAVLAHPDEAMSTVATARYDAESDSWSGAGHPYYPSAPSTSSALKTLRSLMSLPSRPSDSATIAAISPPHCLNARLTATGGDCVALAGISAGRFPGWLPAEMLLTSPAADSSASIPMACKVTFADGSSCVRSAVTRAFAFGVLSPLLVYPSGDAVALELFFGHRSIRVPLVSDPSGCFSYWLSPDGMPVEVDENMPAFVHPSADSAPRLFPGLVAVASAADPLSPMSVTRISGDEPVALAAAPSLSGAWDAGSARFYLFGPDGTRSLTANASRSRLTARTIDSRPVESPDAVCSIGSDGLALLAGSDLLMLKGQRISTLRSFVGAASIGWNPVEGEIYCFHSPDSPCPENFTLVEGRERPVPLFPDAMVFRPDGGELFSRSCPRPLTLLSDAAGLLALDADGFLYDFSREDPDSEVEVIFRSTLPLSDPAVARREFAIPLFGRVSDGHVELRADNGAGPLASDLLASWEVSGTVTHIPPCALLAPHRHNFILSLRATTSSILLSQSSS